MSINKALIKISQEDFNIILNSGKRSNSLLGYRFDSLIDFSFKFVKEDLPSLLTLLDFERVVLRAFKDREIYIFHHDLDSASNNEIMYFICWLSDELKSVYTLEKNNLGSKDPNPELIQAGISDLNVFGDMNIIDTLAGGDILKHEAIKKLPYKVIFDKQFKSVIENNIQTRIREAQDAKRKNKN